VTRDEALKLVERIKHLADTRQDKDPHTGADNTIRNSSQAHSLEDHLRRSILMAIAEGAPSAQELAKIALSTDDFNFYRWYS
jgi:hypothetical protein